MMPGHTARRLALLTALLFLLPFAIAANDPGHDSLYVLKIGDSNVTGTINFTGNVTASFVRFTGKSFGDYLDILANGTVLGAPSTPRIMGATSSLYIDSSGDLYLNTKGGTTSIVQVGDTATNGITLNVSGVIRQQNVLVCLSNGSNCISGTNGGNVSTVTAGSGLSNSGTANDPVLDINAGDGLSISSDTLIINNASVCRSDGTGCPSSSGSSSAAGWHNTSTLVSLNSNTTNVSIGNTTGDAPLLLIDSTNQRIDIGPRSGNALLAINQTSTTAPGLSIATPSSYSADAVVVTDSSGKKEISYNASDHALHFGDTNKATSFFITNNYRTGTVAADGDAYILLTYDPRLQLGGATVEIAPGARYWEFPYSTQEFRTGAGGILTWTSHATDPAQGTVDTGIARGSSGTINITTGATSTSLGNLTANTIRASSDVTVNGLSVCRSDGTNCPASSNSGSGWQNTSTLVSLSNNNTNVSIGNTTGNLPLMLIDTTNNRVNLSVSTLQLRANTIIYATTSGNQGGLTIAGAPDGTNSDITINTKGGGHKTQVGANDAYVAFDSNAYLISTGTIYWATASDYNTKDVAIAKDAAGRLKITDASTGYGNLTTGYLGVNTNTYSQMLTVNGSGNITGNLSLGANDSQVKIGQRSIGISTGRDGFATDYLRVTDGGSGFGEFGASGLFVGGTSPTVYADTYNGGRLYMASGTNLIWSSQSTTPPYGNDGADALIGRIGTGSLGISNNFLSSSNLEWLGLNLTAGEGVHVYAGTKGTGVDDLNVTIDAAGTGVVNINTLRVSTKQVCLADGTNCPASGSSNSAAGWQNSSTLVTLSTNTTNVSIGNTTGNIPVLFIDDASGRVGIGTGAPSKRFVINNSDISSDASSQMVVSGGSDVGVGFEWQTNASGGHRYSAFTTGPSASVGAGQLAIFDITANAYRFVLNASGYVGINVTNPTSLLDVGGPLSARTITTSGKANSIGSGNGSYLLIGQNYAAGDVSTELSPTLYLYSNGNNYGIKLHYDGSQYGTMVFAPTGAHFVSFGQSGTSASREADFTEAMRVNLANGNVGINTTNPGSTLDVKGTINASSIKVGTTNVCLSDGTNCPVSASPSSAAGWQNSSTLVSLNSNTTNVSIGNTTGNRPVLLIDNTNKNLTINTLNRGLEISDTGARFLWQGSYRGGILAADTTGASIIDSAGNAGIAGALTFLSGDDVTIGYDATSDGITLDLNHGIHWTASTAISGTKDLGLARSTNNTLQITDGTTGYGNLTAGYIGVNTNTLTNTLSVNGSVNVSRGNISIGTNYSMCFNTGCTARIYYNGTNLVIEGQ